MNTTDKETERHRGMIVTTRKTSHNQRENVAIDLLRQPSLPKVGLANLFKFERASVIRDSPTSDGLSLLLTFLNNEMVKNVLFCYLYQVNDWFSSNECCKGGEVDTSKGYLIYNREFKAIQK